MAFEKQSFTHHRQGNRPLSLTAKSPRAITNSRVSRDLQVKALDQAGAVALRRSQDSPSALPVRSCDRCGWTVGCTSSATPPGRYAEAVRRVDRGAVWGREGSEELGDSALPRTPRASHISQIGTFHPNMRSQHAERRPAVTRGSPGPPGRRA